MILMEAQLLGVTHAYRKLTLLRQGDAKMFKKYSQMKLQMKREALKEAESPSQ